MSKFCCRHELLYSKVETVSWIQVPFVHSDTAHDYFFIDHLTPKTHYMFRLKILFTDLAPPYIWPSENKFIFETLGKISVNKFLFFINFN